MFIFSVSSDIIVMPWTPLHHRCIILERSRHDLGCRYLLLSLNGHTGDLGYIIASYLDALFIVRLLSSNDHTCDLGFIFSLSPDIIITP